MPKVATRVLLAGIGLIVSAIMLMRVALFCGLLIFKNYLNITNIDLKYCLRFSYALCIQILNYFFFVELLSSLLPRRLSELLHWFSLLTALHQAVITGDIWWLKYALVDMSMH